MVLYGKNKESIEGFVCVAAPITNNHEQIVAALSITMLNDNYLKKKEHAEKLILNVTRNISEKVGAHI
jgi:IclR family KDG regulon transcriptional repressor